jgi:Amt family ammonium transporter
MSSHPSWLLFAALIMLMQAGFGLLTTGLCRAKNAGQIISSNLMILAGSLLAFWICGFAFLFTGHGFFFTPSEIGAASVPSFIIAALLVSIAAVIPAGAMAERWSFKSIVLYGFWVGALPISIFGHWIWGGGWLARLGQTCALGHGVVDFAGSSVIHLAAGVIALAGSSILGPRAGKYARDGRPKPMPGHNLVFVAIGTLILFAGWFGFNSASPAMDAGDQLGVLALNTLLAGAAGGFAACVTTVRKFGKPDPSMLSNGILAGLVAISASCPFVNSTAAALTGALAGFLVVHSVLLFEGRLKVDDPVGAISVHGVGGAWGMISLGLFANGSFGSGWNGVLTETGVTGAFGMLFGAPSNDWSQLAAQCSGVLVCLPFIGAMAVVWFKISNLITPLRVRRDVELAGLDLPETGAECYPDFHLTDQGGASS